MSSTHKESQRLAALDSAAAMIEGRLGIIEGCRNLHGFTHDLVPNWAADEDFAIFGVVSSDTDAFPLGSVRQHWDALALKREDAKIADAENFYREDVLAACHRLLRRLRDAQY